jgi:hypothetical protein
MTNVQFYLAIGLPSFLVILSWLSNRSDAAQLRAEISGVRNELGREIGGLRNEVNTLRSEMHKDMLQLLTQMVAA